MILAEVRADDDGCFVFRQLLLVVCQQVCFLCGYRGGDATDAAIVQNGVMLSPTESTTETIKRTVQSEVTVSVA